MINLVDEEKPDIMAVSKANLERDYKSLDIDFKEYEIESKFIANNNLARIMIVLRNNITYEHLKKFETDENAMVVLNVKTGQNKYAYLLCV